MLLAIDAGNTNTVFAVFSEDKIKGQWRMSAQPKHTADEYAVYLKQFLKQANIDFGQITGVIISSVVPQNIFPFKSLCRNYFSCEPWIVGESQLDIGIKIMLDKPSEIGADRLVNSVAAYDKFNDNVVIVDFGTATNFDVVSSKGEYLGGVISPGINLSIDALHKAAAKLPEVEVAKPSKVIGTSTESAMQSGIYWGYVGLIEGLIKRIKEEFGQDMQVLATGGLAPLFASAIDAIEHLEPDLTITGLNLIYKRNCNKYDVKLKKA